MTPSTLHRVPVGQGPSGPDWLAISFGFWSERALATGTAWAGLCLIHHHHETYFVRKTADNARARKWARFGCAWGDTHKRARAFPPPGPPPPKAVRPHIRVSKRSRAPPTTNNQFVLEPNEIPRIHKNRACAGRSVDTRARRHEVCGIYAPLLVAPAGSALSEPTPATPSER